MPQAVEHGDPSFLGSAATTLRLIVGWAFVALGVLDLAMGLDGVAYVVFHVMLLITGAVLLSGGRIGRGPSRAAQLAGGLVAGLGLVGTAIPALAMGCCSQTSVERHGFPFTIVARDPGGWRFDGFRTGADLIFWLCAGLIVSVVLTRVLPASEKPREVDPGPEAPPTYAKARNSPGRETEDHQSGDQVREARTADGENVGGLP